MGEIITAYPTSGLTDRSLNSINMALFDYISAIPEISGFFDSIEKLGDSASNYSDFGIKMSKGKSFIKTQFYNLDGQIRFMNNSNSTSASNTSSANATNLTSATTKVDIAVNHVTGINGTVVVWLDKFSKGICMLLNKFGDKYFIANTSGYADTALNYSDTGGEVNTLSTSFNGDNLYTGGDYIAQPYYHCGVNTGDIYTFDGGSGTSIPYGKFKLGNNDAEFIKLYSNFALRIK